MAGEGTRENPWQLTTPPGTSGYEMYRDEPNDTLVCVVGKTTLELPAARDRGPARHAEGARRLDAARQRRRAEAGGRGHRRGVGAVGDNPVGGWYGLKKGLRGRFGMYVPPLLEALGLAEVEHNPATTACGRSDGSVPGSVARSARRPSATPTEVRALHRGDRLGVRLDGGAGERRSRPAVADRATLPGTLPLRARASGCCVALCSSSARPSASSSGGTYIAEAAAQALLQAVPAADRVVRGRGPTPRRCPRPPASARRRCRAASSRRAPSASRADRRCSAGGS